jgi:hypothetical protein
MFVTSMRICCCCCCMCICSIQFRIAISTLLQFFLDQNCLKKGTILDWNSNGHSYNDVYYKETKRYAQPFIQQLMASN